MIVIARLRGTVNVTRKVGDTLDMLNLKKVNNCVVVPDVSSYQGMLKIIKDYAAYGPIDKKTFVELLKKRGRVEGNKPLTEEYLKKNKFTSFESFADAV